MEEGRNREVGSKEEVMRERRENESREGHRVWRQRRETETQRVYRRVCSFEPTYICPGSEVV